MNQTSLQHIEELLVQLSSFVTKEKENQEYKNTETPESNLTKAMQVLRKCMSNDFKLAWSWQCNIACALVTEDIPYAVANRAATQFMLQVFMIDTSPKAYAKHYKVAYNEQD